MSAQLQTPADPVLLIERLPGHVTRITLNRPLARNAINGDITRALDAALLATEQDDDVRAVVLTGSGREAFCAGADLKEVAAGRGRQLRTERGGFAGFVYAPRTKPWIAAINGPALAGGTEIALACDLLVAADTATFGLPEVQRGLIAGAGGLYRLPRALPRHVALELVATGDPLQASRAHQFGLINHLVATPELQDTALSLAQRIARNAPLAVRESLAIARQAHDLDEAPLRQLSAESLARVAASEDLREGLQAFIEKRAPQWRGC